MYPRTHEALPQHPCSVGVMVHHGGGKGGASPACQTGAPPSLSAPCLYEKLYILEHPHLLVFRLGNHGVKQLLLHEGTSAVASGHPSALVVCTNTRSRHFPRAHCSLSNILIHKYK